MKLGVPVVASYHTRYETYLSHYGLGVITDLVGDLITAFYSRCREVYVPSNSMAGEELVAAKMFHVSPFCRIEGGYRFRFLEARGHAVARIDYDDADGPLLLTSLSGRMAPMTDRTLLSAFLHLPLFTFGVVARIHWQALKLFYKRIPFVPKPHPPAAEVT